MSNKQPTKLVRINLSALTRVEYCEVVEVPASFSEGDIQEVIDTCYKQVDGGAYVDDVEFWEKGECWSEEACEGEGAQVIASRTDTGELQFKF